MSKGIKSLIIMGIATVGFFVSLTFSNWLAGMWAIVFAAGAIYYMADKGDDG